VEGNTFKADTAQQELQALREEIKQFADTLQIIESTDPTIQPSEVIATLTGIGQGALSCAALLKHVMTQTTPKGRLVHSSIETKRIQIREDAGEILRHCAELSKLLRRVKRNASGIPSVEMGEMAEISQQVQTAISSVAMEWEDLA
jgi:hypothetical protein